MRLVIIGAGGHGSELVSYIRDIQAAGRNIKLLGFVDEVHPPGPLGASEILGDFSSLARLVQQANGVIHYITAIGDNRARERFVSIIDALEAPNLRPWTLRHPSSVVGEDSYIGEGTCLAPGTIVTSRVRIGRHCILNVKTSVSHDSTVDDFANLNPGATLAGNVRAGRGSFIGAGATVIQRVTIGPEAVIGAGAVVIQDVPTRVTAVGVPARPVKHHVS